MDCLLTLFPKRDDAAPSCPLLVVVMVVVEAVVVIAVVYTVGVAVTEPVPVTLGMLN